jgi:hypothetical protein
LDHAERCGWTRIGIALLALGANHWPDIVTQGRLIWPIFPGANIVLAPTGQHGPCQENKLEGVDRYAKSFHGSLLDSIGFARRVFTAGKLSPLLRDSGVQHTMNELHIVNDPQ